MKLIAIVVLAAFGFSGHIAHADSLPVPSELLKTDFVLLSSLFGTKPYQFAPVIRNVSLVPTTTSTKILLETDTDRTVSQILTWDGNGTPRLVKEEKIKTGRKQVTLPPLPDNAPTHLRLFASMGIRGGSTLTRELILPSNVGVPSSGILLPGDVSAPSLSRLRVATTATETKIRIDSHEDATFTLDYGNTPALGMKQITPLGRSASFAMPRNTGQLLYVRLSLEDASGNVAIIPFSVASVDVAGSTVTFERPRPTKPSIEIIFTASSQKVRAGESVLLKWSVTDLKPSEPGDIKCIAGGGWSGERTADTTDRQGVVQPTKTTSYLLSCKKDDLPAGSKKIQITVYPPPIPQRVSTSTAAQPVSSSPPITVTTPPPGSSMPPPLPPGAFGVGRQFFQPNLDKVAVALVASATHVKKGTKYTISWNAPNAQKCYASDDWKGEQKTSGKAVILAKRSMKFTLNCYADMRDSGTASIIVKIKAPVVKKITKK